MARIRKKDKVEVLSGRDRGKRGEVLQILPERGRALVSKVNLVVKHKRPTQAAPGGREHIEAPLPLARLMLVCPKCDKAMRPKADRLQTGEKVRVCRECGEVIL